jgi:hypothetical protein
VDDELALTAVLKPVLIAAGYQVSTLCGIWPESGRNLG